MADVKISALPLASTPLAGTEVLPIVQSATTDQVTVANLTAGRTVSAAGLTLTTTPLAVGSGGTGFSSITSGYVPYATAANTLGATSGLQFDGNNLGLGVTPSAWASPFTKAFDIGSTGSIATTPNSLRFANNAYYGSSGWTYKNTASAAHYDIINNEHSWYNAASGTANTSISFTQAMTLDASGNLGVGVTNPSYAKFIVASTGGAGISIAQGTENFYGASSHKFFNEGYTTQRMTLDASGNLLVGTTSSRNRLTVASGTTVSSPTLGTLSGTTFFGGSDMTYGLMTGQSSSGQYWAQVQRVDGTATAYDLLLQPSGGNLLVGTTSVGVGKTTIYSATNSQAAIDGRITVTGDVGTRALYLSKFDNNSTTSQIFVQFAMNNGATGQGQINANGANTAAFGTYSDRRLKENIVDLSPQLDNILALQPREFDYIESEGSGHQIGFVAQEMREVYPDAVGERADGMLTVTAWSKTEARLVRAIQELAAKVQALEAKVA